MTLLEAVKRNLTQLNSDLRGFPTCPCCSSARNTMNAFIMDLQDCDDPEVQSYLRGEDTDAGIVDHE